MYKRMTGPEGISAKWAQKWRNGTNSTATTPDQIRKNEMRGRKAMNGNKSRGKVESVIEMEVHLFMFCYVVRMK
jgi:hypothetical protein